jgi:hypothetical protein
MTLEAWFRALSPFNTRRCAFTHPASVGRKVTFQAVQKFDARRPAHIPCNVDGLKIEIVELDPEEICSRARSDMQAAYRRLHERLLY